MRTVLWVLIAALIVTGGVFGFIAWKRHDAKSASDRQAAISRERANATVDAVREAQAIERQDPVRVTVAELEKLYAENQVAANSKFTRKLLLLDGYVSKVETDTTDPWFAVLHLRSRHGVICSFDDRGQQDRLAELKAGQRIELRGIGVGLVEGVGIGLTRCRIEGVYR